MLRLYESPHPAEEANLMRYRDFKQRILDMATLATDSCRREFAIDTIRRLHDSAAEALESELLPDELRLAQHLVENFKEGNPQHQFETLNALSDAMSADGVRAIEFHYDITEWMCALENWFTYRLNNEPSSIAGIAINMVNSIDQNLDDDPAGYSNNNMLGAPEMVAEYERQQRLLISQTDSR